jgi:methyl coenzyme M reductase subunit D
MDDDLKKLMEAMAANDPVARVMLNDQRLSKLAEYVSTEGYTKVKIEPEVIQSKFVELKGMVKGGEFTLEALEQDLYTKYGVDEVKGAVEPPKAPEVVPSGSMSKIGFAPRK